MSPFLGSGLTSFLTQGPYSPDNFVRDRFLSKNIFRRGRSPAFHAHCEKVACVSGARETYIGAQITKAQFSRRAVRLLRAQYFYAPATRAKGHVTYAAFNGQCSLKPRAKGHNIVGCYFLRPFAHPFACCCVLLGVVAQSLKLVKLWATKLGVVGQQCCVRLHGA